MKLWLRGKRGALIAFVLISTLVAGGLGWVTAAALRLEQQQLEARAEAEHYNKLRLALWRLDTLIAPALAKEDSRPYNHYSAIFAPPLVLQTGGKPYVQGTVLEPSPLLSADVPDWMLLHFQVDPDSGWRSPQVLSQRLADLLEKTGIQLPPKKVMRERQQLLAELTRHLQADRLVALVRAHASRPPLEDVTLMPSSNTLNPANALANNPGPGQSAKGGVDPEYRTRLNRQMSEKQQLAMPKAQYDDPSVALENTSRNGEDLFSQAKGKQTRREKVVVALGPMVPLWLSAQEQPERLVLARHVQIGKKEVCQGIVLDWPRLQTLLAEEAEKEDLFPSAQIHPVREEFPAHSERTMTVLPLELDADSIAAETAPAGWTPLRVGLTLAWAAALVALLAVGLGGWSLLDLSERRIRFVSAVTHELRTPLTTLRLYLDMLAGGMVKEEKQKEEYLQTLNAEADRLNRLVGNVLDFSRLENQRPRLAMAKIRLGDLLLQVHSTWQGRCQSAEKDLVLENTVGNDAQLFTDVHLVQQILGNLIDNACKYSRGADDRRIWLRARSQGGHRLVLEVEDRGPGVSQPDRRTIFRPFRRGHSVEVSAGGVGLGLALAQRWARLLGGKLTLQAAAESAGACFRLELPLAYQSQS